MIFIEENIIWENVNKICMEYEKLRKWGNML